MATTTHLLGRDRDVELLERAFGDVEGGGDDGARLVTITGARGIGKSALARSYAERKMQNASIAWVHAQGATNIAELCDRVLTASEHAADPSLADDVERAAAALNARAASSKGPVLLVLDDFDAFATEARAAVLPLLDRCADLSIMVTSRARLALDPLEHVHEVGPILEVADRIAIMCRAAARAALGFEPAPEDRATLIEIARRLEGIPLALERAGARLPLLGAAALLASPDLARDHGEDERALIGMLSPSERDVLVQLTVFRGGFTADAIRAVVVPAGALSIVTSLHARSLVRTVGDGRLDLYAHTRDALAAMASAHEEQVVGDAAVRHGAYFVGLIESGRADARADRDNVLEVVRRVALPASSQASIQWGLQPQAPIRWGEKDRAEIAIRALLAMKDVFFSSSSARLTSSVASSAEIALLASPLVERTRDSGADPKLSARAMLLRGALRRERGDVRASLKDLLAAESIARAVRDDDVIGEALIELGKTLRAACELDAAKQNFDGAARAFAKAGHRAREAEATALLAATTGEGGDLDAAIALAARAVAMARAGGDRRAHVLAPSLHLLAARAYAEKRDASRARVEIDAAVAASPSHDSASRADAFLLRGLLFHDEANLSAATSAFETARDHFEDSGLPIDAAIARGYLGTLAREQGSLAEAYALLADARDVCLRARRARHAALFGAHLAAIESRLHRDDAAKEILRQIDEAKPLCESLWWPVEERAWTKPATLHGRLFARGDKGERATPSVGTSAALPDDALVVGAEGAWFRLPFGARVGLERRRSLALLLDCLAKAAVEAQRTSSVTSLRAGDLFAAAWPGEKAIPSAAAHRVRVAVATLRKMGLRDALLTTPDGYALTPDLRVFRP